MGTQEYAMDIVEISAKGEMTLPARVRESLGIADEGYLAAEKVGPFVVLRKLEAPPKSMTTGRESAPASSA